MRKTEAPFTRRRCENDTESLRIVGTFCKTKIAIFVKARGRGAKKMAHVREYPHESSCGRPSSRTNFSFRDRTFVR